MYAQLLRRHRGVQRAVKRLWLPVRLDQCAFPGGRVNEAMLVQMLPAGWLPAPPKDILLSIAHARGSTGLTDVALFRPWARHFDCYVLELWREEPHG